MEKKLNTILICLFIVSLGFNLFFLTKKPKIRELPDYQSPLPVNQNLKLISPLKQGALLESNEIIHYIDLKPKLDEIISKSAGIERVSIFLQDSKTGAWLGINEKEGFIPASLLKIPIMMAVLKKFEREEIKMTDIVELKPDDLDKNSGDLYKNGVGYKISIWDLVKKMILASDNTAKNALKRQLSDEELNAVFAHVGIANPYEEQGGHTVTARDYNRLFKSLYFSTFLSPSLSEKALDITTDTEMENLISAGIPPEVQVAHKYGERLDGISDCGIIYHNKGPYFLCVMVKSTQTVKAKDLIISLSKTIYDHIEESSLTPSPQK